jgi:hypothetical protein
MLLVALNLAAADKRSHKSPESIIWSVLRCTSCAKSGAQARIAIISRGIANGERTETATLGHILRPKSLSFPGFLWGSNPFCYANESWSSGILRSAEIARASGRSRTPTFPKPPENNERIMINSMPVMACRCRPHGFVEFFDRRWLGHTGLTLDQALGWGWTVAIHADDLNQCAHSIQQVA